MLDIKYIREHQKEIKQAIVEKRIKLNLDQLLAFDDKRRALVKQIDDVRSERKKSADRTEKATGKKRETFIEEGKKIKERIAQFEVELHSVGEEYENLMIKVPTIPSADTPRGKDDSENVEVYRSGEPTKFDFKPRSHIELAESLDLIDFERGAKAAGYRGYYLKNEAVMLQMGLLTHALKKAISHGFTPIIPPTLVKEFVLFGSGYFSGRKYNPETDEIYKIANEDKLADGTLQKEDRFLVGTAEPSLLAYYANEVLDEKQLPLKLCGFSQCYRSEIGSYGKDTKGLYRVHEFMKVELVGITQADVAVAEKLHTEMLDLAKELHTDLGLPYRVIQICTGDMSAGKYKQFDIEAWMPSRDGWGETGSASNFLDWQSQRLNVRYKDAQGEFRHVYMLNATALPSPRPLIAILENYQTKEGEVVVPQLLRDYVQKEKIGKSKAV